MERNDFATHRHSGQPIDRRCAVWPVNARPTSLEHQSKNIVVEKCTTKPMNHKVLGLNLGLAIIAISTTFTGAIAIAGEATSWRDDIIKVGTVDDYLPCSDQIDQHFEGPSTDIWRRISERLNVS